MISIGNLQINKLYLGDVEVTKAYLGDVEVYGSNKKYMTMTVLDGASGTTIAPTLNGSFSTKPNLQYRINNGSWSDFVFGTTAAITAQTGDTVQWKGVNESGISVSERNYMKFSISGNPVALSGNVMSLIDGVGDSTVIPRDYCFYKMFSKSNVKTVSQDFLPATTLTTWCYSDLFNESLLENAPELPATTLAGNCYQSMFYGCTSLTTAPVLPATTLADNCYTVMFGGCSSLVNAPALPATTLAGSCYRSMFNGCTSLTTAPELHVTTLAEGCYSGMFDRCTSLTTAPVLPATTLAASCYQSMFEGCTSLTTAPVLPATTLSDNCYTSMLQGCTSLTTAPDLPATTLANSCYNYMFYGCTSLSTAPELPATTLSDNCYGMMFGGCTSLTTAPELPSTTIADSCYSGMFWRCSSLVNAPVLPATTLAGSCYLSMFRECTSLTTAPVLPGTTLASNCYSRMFEGCTALTTAPELPATTLAYNCYSYMFEGCSNLSYVKSLATDITASNALKNWLLNVSQTGTFVKPAGVSYETGISGIPKGWTVVEEKPKPEGKYMTMTVLDGDTGTTIAPTVNGSLPNLNLQYRVNNGEWSDFIVGTTAAIKVVAGDVVQWKGNNSEGISTSYPNYLNFGVSGNPVALSGNIMSLIDGVGDALVVPSAFCFCSLFYNSSIKTVSSDFLPATTLADNCYRELFSNCQILTQAPALPATTLKSYCYTEMFRYCYELKQAPELPAKVLVDGCYKYMFQDSSSLNYVKCLATDNISTSTISSWLSGVSSTGTFEKPTKAKYLNNSGSGIPSGWTVVNL